MAIKGTEKQSKAALTVKLGRGAQQSKPCRPWTGDRLFQSGHKGCKANVAAELFEIMLGAQRPPSTAKSATTGRDGTLPVRLPRVCRCCRGRHRQPAGLPRPLRSRVRTARSGHRVRPVYRLSLALLATLPAGRAAASQAPPAFRARLRPRRLASGSGPGRGRPAIWLLSPLGASGAIPSQSPRSRALPCVAVVTKDPGRLGRRRRGRGGREGLPRRGGG